MSDDLWNPKQENHLPAARVTRRKKIGGFAPLPNPIPAVVEDAKEIKEAFKTLPLIPYSSSKAGTGQLLLTFFEDLTRLSVTNGGVIREKLKYCFDGPYMAEQSEAEVLGDMIWSEGSDTAMTQLTASIGSRVFFQGSYRETVRALGNEKVNNGNMAVKLIQRRTEGGLILVVEPVLMRNFLYTDMLDGMEAVAIFDKMPINKKEFNKKLDDGDMQIITTFPNFVEVDGDLVSFLHSSGSNQWYGRPEWEQAWMDAYREFQDRIHLIKESDSEWVGRVIIEVEDEPMPNGQSIINDDRDRGAGYGSTADRMAVNFTREGDNPQQFMITSRPSGASAMAVRTIPPMSNNAFWKISSEINRDSIILAHGWSRRLMGQEFGGGFATKQFFEELEVKEVTAIRPLRNEVVNFLWRAYEWFLTENGLGGRDVRINFETPFKQLKEDAKADNSEGGNI